MNQVIILQGDVRAMLKTLSPESVQCAVTSPPYWGLRDYGIEGQVWGGEEGCGHEWGNEKLKSTGRHDCESRALLDGSIRVGGGPEKAGTGRFCRLCGAWKGSYGLEPTIEMYVEHTVQIFREVRRVLRKDGTCWINLGDSYMANASSQAPQTKDHKGSGFCGPNRQPQSKLKPKDLCGIPWRVALALQADGWYLRSDIIWAKCLSGGTRLYARTQKGEMPSTLKDLVRLDPATVQLWNGKDWVQVKSWTKSPRTGTEKEIVFRSGERVGCTLDHRWPTTKGLIQTRDLQVGDIVNVCSLSEPEFPRDPDYIPDEIGWFVGLYIAEGSQSQGTIQISSHLKESERFKKLALLAEVYDGYLAVHQTSENGATANLNSPVLLGIINAYVSGKTAKDKHLDMRCWKRSNTFLRCVLEGYLSGDGHWRKNRWKVGFCANDNLSADLRTLCARLGLSIRLKRTKHSCNGKKFPGWRGEIKDNHRNSGGEIIAIVPSRARIFWDIEVEGDPHLFSLASGVLTHNSNPMPESCTDRPTRAHEYIFLLTKSAKYFYDQEAVREAPANYDRKGGKAEYTADSGHTHGVGSNSFHQMSPNGRNLRSVWQIATAPFPQAHFATFPPTLPERCIKAGTSEKGCCPKCGAPWVRVVEKGKVICVGGSDKEGRAKKEMSEQGPMERRKADGSNCSQYATQFKQHEHITTGWTATCKCGLNPIPCAVLDPFSGAGTTAMVAAKLGRNAIGIELNPEYVAMSVKRLRQELGMLTEISLAPPPPK